MSRGGDEGVRWGVSTKDFHRPMCKKESGHGNRPDGLVVEGPRERHAC